MMNISLMFLITFMLAILTFTLQYYHFLMALFSLEAMLLSSMLSIVSTSYQINMFLPNLALLMLTIGACEASIGLSLMVSMSRNSGNDMLNTMNMMKF